MRIIGYMNFKQISWNLTEKVFSFFQSLWWERRTFPLKDEDTEALLCQDEKKDHSESSSPVFRGEVFCTSAPENGHHPKRQTDEMEECKPFGLGLTHVKKNRWQGKVKKVCNWMESRRKK